MVVTLFGECFADGHPTDGMERVCSTRFAPMADGGFLRVRGECNLQGKRWEGEFVLSTESLAEHVVEVLGVRFHRTTSAEAIELMLHWIAEKSRRMVITAGPEFVMKSQEVPEVLKISRAADLVTADGIGVVWAAARMGRPVPERVTGVELVLELLKEATRRNQTLRVYLLGSSLPSLEACLAVLRRDFPMHQFAGRDGYFPTTEMPHVMEAIADFAPDVWLVGMGQPRQEQVIYQWLSQIPPCVAIGVGGSFDVWGGTVPRAPQIFRKLNVEWLYRLLREPSRIRRQTALPRFAWRVVRQNQSYAPHKR